MKLSVIIPAHNEEGSIEATVSAISERLARADIEHEIVVVNDNCQDQTEDVVKKLIEVFPVVRLVANPPPNGFGFAVRKGLQAAQGDAVVIAMADAADDPDDIVTYYKKLEEGYDCVFGSRFIKGSAVNNYPYHKLLLNRMANLFIRFMFGIRYNDTTNAFKCFRMEVIRGVQPLLSHHFNLTVELPLKAIVRGYSYAVVPIQWRGRVAGLSKLKIQEMGSRYLFIVLYVWLEKWLSRGDYKRDDGREP